MKKRLSLLFVFAFFLFSLSVNAENKYLEKEFGVRDGYTYNDAINWSNVNEVEDGYIITTLSSSGSGVIRKIDKNDGSIIWENYNEYGIFYADVYFYKDKLYTICYDYYYGTILIVYDKNGNYVSEMQIDDWLDNAYVYAGETYLHGKDLYFIYKSQYNDGTSDTMWGPEYIIKIDLDKFKIIEQDDYENYTPNEIEYITYGQSELISEKLNHVYSEKGYKTHIYQQMIRDKYKYYIGTLYNDSESYGLVVKTDLNNNVIWTQKSKENNMSYYDCAYLGTDIIAVSGYMGNVNDYPKNLRSEIRIIDANGNIVETHDVQKELGVANADIITLKDMSDGVVAQVITWHESSYQSFILKYSIKPFDIEKEVKGKGEVVVDKNALPGTEVEFSVTPGEGYTVKEVTIIDEYGNIIILDGNKFIMPNGKVTIRAEFVEKVVENPEMGISSIAGIGILGVLAITLIYIIFRRYTRFGNLN